MGAGLYLYHANMLVISFTIDMCVSTVYLAQWVFYQELYTLASWMGMVCSFICGIMAFVLSKSIKKEVKQRRQQSQS